MFRKPEQNHANFQAPIFWSACMGSVLCIGFYALLEFGPVRLPLVERYAKCHAVAYASVELFFVALCALVYKFIEVRRQLQLMGPCQSAIDEIKIARTDETSEDEISQIQWLDAAWKSQTALVYTSALGCRIRELLSVQLRRKTLSHVDADIASQSDRAMDEQHDSYAMVRIVTWAMPMLGFLGTVIGISDTLGQMDAAALASGSQDAMNSLTAGLYVAFDTTAVGLVLTMVAMFIQFSVNKSELRLLSSLDRSTADLMGTCLVVIPKAPELSGIERTLERVTAGLLETVDSLISKQADLWRTSLDVAQAKWTEASTESTLRVQSALDASIQNSLAAIKAPILEANLEIIASQRVGSQVFAEMQAQAAERIGLQVSRLHDLLSEQANLSHAQLESSQQLTQQVSGLLSNSQMIQAMEEPLQRNLERLTDVDRFHDAAVCLTEAIAMLGTQLERSGLIGRNAVHRIDAARPLDSHDSPVVVPMRRKAG